MTEVDMKALEVSTQEPAMATATTLATSAPPVEVPSTLNAVAEFIKRTKEHVEGVTTHMLSTIEGAENELKNLRDTVLNDAARIKTELDGHMLSAEAISRKMGEIVALAGEIKNRRSLTLDGDGK